MVISKDLSGIAHPLHVPWLNGHLQQIIGKDYEINTGVIAGQVDDLIKIYSNILVLRDEYLHGMARNNVFEKLFAWKQQHPPHDKKFSIENDDQALHYLNIITHPEWYQIDADKVLSAFITDFPGDPRLCDPPHQLHSIGSASILHGSRPASRGHWEKMCRKRWWEEDESKREKIPVQIPALELNVTYVCNLKCEYCAHLGRYLKGHVSLASIKEWLDSWKHKLLPGTVRILGGEPMLHKELDQIVRLVHETWIESHRVIITNGLIERSDHDFLCAVRETGTHIHVSVHDQ